MTAKELIRMIDPNTPVVISDSNTDEILWESWENSNNDIPDRDVCEDFGIFWSNSEKHLVIYVE